MLSLLKIKTGPSHLFLADSVLTSNSTIFPINLSVTVLSPYTCLNGETLFQVIITGKTISPHNVRAALWARLVPKTNTSQPQRGDKVSAAGPKLFLSVTGLNLNSQPLCLSVTSGCFCCILSINWVFLLLLLGLSFSQLLCSVICDCALRGNYFLMLCYGYLILFYDTCTEKSSSSPTHNDCHHNRASS